MLQTFGAAAFTLSTGEEVQCEVSVDGRQGLATEIWSHYQRPEDRHPELGRAVAVMRTDADGWPTIILDGQAHERTGKGLPGMWDFLFFHECAHAQHPELSEIEANCVAYKEVARRGMMTLHRKKQIETVHMGMMSLPAEYGGSGAQFWHQTLLCARSQ